MLRTAAIALLAAPALGEAPAPSDLKRARTSCPRAEFKGKGGLVDTNRVLNGHLAQMESLSTRACETFSASALQGLSHVLYGVADPAMLEVYEAAEDNRRQVYRSKAEMDVDFERLNKLVHERAELHDVLRDGLCHRVVMWFIHHLPVSKQHELSTTSLVLPRLPVSDHTQAADSYALASTTTPVEQRDTAAEEVHATYKKSVTCQKCHVGGIDSLGVPEVKPTTPKQMARRCYTNYKDLFGITCGPCDGIAGTYWGDDDDKYFTPDPCTVVAQPADVPEAERVMAAFPPQFSVDVMAGSDRWGRTTNPSGHVKTPFPPIIDSMYGRISGNWYADITGDSDLWMLRHDTTYADVHFNGTKVPFVGFHVSEIHSQTRAQQAVNNTGPMVSLISGIPDWIPGGCTCVADPVGVPDVAHTRTGGLVPESAMEFLGRINLTLAEFDGKTVTVDHWANWFFHVFMETDKTVPNYGRAPKRLASAYAGTAVYANWKFGDPKVLDPTIWHRGIPSHPEKVGPDHGKYCLNPQKIAMCNNISQQTFPPKPEAPPTKSSVPWSMIHKHFLPTLAASGGFSKGRH